MVSPNGFHPSALAYIEVKMSDTIENLIDSGRRTFVFNGSLFLVGAAVLSSGCDAREAAMQIESEAKIPTLKFGLVTDIHHADKDPAGTRYYRESIGKLREAVKAFKKSQPRFVVALGDVIDAADEVETEKRYLKQVHHVLTTAPGENHYVLGNHCVHTLMKEEFLGEVGQQKSAYSFDESGYHFVILDSCFRSDGQPYGRNNFTWTDANIPDEQLEWLKADLAATDLETIVFVHQRLDEAEQYSVKNARQVRAILEQSAKVRVVFQGHSHENSLQEIGGIQYCVLAAMIEGSGAENNGYSNVEIFEDQTIRVAGFRKQTDYRWSS